MATYNEIKGDTIEVRATDPANPVEGEIWYNSTTGVLKGIELIAAFASGGSMSNARTQATAGIGTKDAAIAAGLSATDGTSEEYNGTVWSGGGSLNNAGTIGTGAGTLSAGSRFGGIQPTPLGKDSNYHEQYDGTSWTISTGMPFDSYQNACGGTQTANIVIQSFFNPSPSTGGFPSATSEWDGSSWTAGGSINTTRREAFSSQGGGLQTSTFLAGGSNTGGIQSASETYDGSSWTSTSPLNTGRLRGGGGGTATNGIVISGTTTDPQAPGLTTASEGWDGTSWTTNPYSVATATWSGGSAVTSNTSGIIFGGSSAAGAVTGSEELNLGPGVRTFTTS